MYQVAAIKKLKDLGVKRVEFNSNGDAISSIEFFEEGETSKTNGTDLEDIVRREVLEHEEMLLDGREISGQAAEAREKLRLEQLKYGHSQ